MSDWNPHEIALGLGMRVDTAYDDSKEGRAEKVKAWERALDRCAKNDAKADKRRHKEEEACALRFAKAALKAGLPLYSVTRDGVLRLGKTEAAAAPAEVNELDHWLIRHPEHARSPERH